MTGPQPPTWIFVRGAEQLIVQRSSDHELSIIAGDDPARSFFFDSLLALTNFQLNLEDDLLDEGWTLSCFAPDRRRGRDDRRVTPRSGPDRRRRFGPSDPVH